MMGASQQQFRRRKELKSKKTIANLAFFGLAADAEEKDLNLAYRQMAKKMHPDKNGGSEDAKEKFQQMQDKYERLKEKFKPQRGLDEDDVDEDDPEETAPEPPSEGGESPSGQRKPQKEEGDHRIVYDPNDRNSLDAAVWRMLREMRRLEESLAGLEKMEEEVAQDPSAWGTDA